MNPVPQKPGYGVHSQQAAETALKGFLTAHDRPFGKTHDLDELSQASEEIDSTLCTMLSPARDLTVFAWEFRYPGATAVPTVDEAQRALGTAREVYHALRSRLSKGILPAGR